MKIGINGRFLVAKRTGVQRAAYNLLKTLVKVDRENEYLIFTGTSQLGSSDWNYPNVTVIPSKIRGGESIRNHIWEQLFLPNLARKYRVDLLHSPANMAPFFYRGKSVMNIHDLCFVVNPHWYSFSFHTVYNLLIPRLARRATRVITNSNNSRNDLLQYCGVQASKVNRIYWAVDEVFLASKVEPEKHDRLFDFEYILYVGSLEPRKNIRTLVKSFEQLRELNPEKKTKLVLIGGESPLFGDVRLKVQKFDDDVVFKGYVSDAELRAFYRNAAVVVYPSLYEGFGFPPIEAMASGAAVITSDCSSLPEVVGDAAIQVDPYDSDDLTEKIKEVLDNPVLRKKLIEMGSRQSKKFNWYRVARNTLSVYADLEGSKNGNLGSGMNEKTWRRLREMERKFIERPIS